MNVSLEIDDVSAAALAEICNTARTGDLSLKQLKASKEEARIFNSALRVLGRALGEKGFIPKSPAKRATDIFFNYEHGYAIFSFAGECYCIVMSIRHAEYAYADRFYLNPMSSQFDDLVIKHSMTEAELERLVLEPIRRRLAEPVVPDDPDAPPRAHPGAWSYAHRKGLAKDWDRSEPDPESGVVARHDYI